MCPCPQSTTSLLTHPKHRLLTLWGQFALLGISLDEFFGIGDHYTATEETLQAEKVGLEKRLSSKRQIITMMEQGVKTRNRIIAALLVLLFLSITYALYLDTNCIQIGFWRG